MGDLDGDGVPEIVMPNETSGLVILDNKGNPITSTAANQWSGYVNPAPSIANLDNQGFAEIVVGSNVFTLGHDAAGKLVFVDHFAGSLMKGLNTQGPIPAWPTSSAISKQEIVAGSTLYALPTPPPGVTKIADCAAGAMDNFCLGKLDVVWDGQTVNTAAKLPNAQRDGFCAVADILGQNPQLAPSPQNPLDGKPEVALIANGYLVILDSQTGALLRFVNLGSGTNGGAPNVDDFDGDGFPRSARRSACATWSSISRIPLSPARRGPTPSTTTSPAPRATPRGRPAPRAWPTPTARRAPSATPPRARASASTTAGSA